MGNVEPAFAMMVSVASPRAIPHATAVMEVIPGSPAVSVHQSVADEVGAIAQIKARSAVDRMGPVMVRVAARSTAVLQCAVK